MEASPSTSPSSGLPRMPSRSKSVRQLQVKERSAFLGKSEALLRWARSAAKAAAVSAMAFVLLISLLGKPGALVSDDAAHRRVLSGLFIAGLSLVALEDIVQVDKSAVMLVLASTMWVFTAAYYQPTHSDAGREIFHKHLEKALADVGSVVLFLLPAMAVVECMDHFGGFACVTVAVRRLLGSSPARLLPIVCTFSFFMSSVIDNLTATIVALKVLRNVLPHDAEMRKLCGGLVVLAANAGGAWSPVGDVTTTMLWIQDKVTAPKLVASLFLPSLVAGFVPLLGLWWQAARQQRGATAASPSAAGEEAAPAVTRKGTAVLVLGLLCILTVPLLKIWTGLPPYLGMLFALGLVWLAAEALEEKEENSDVECGEAERRSGVAEALHKVDLTGLLFFAGVLMAVVSLDAAGVLARYAQWMRSAFGESALLLSAVLGASSAVVDNVPLVEAAIDMFENGTDDALWQLVALAAGTGGSMLSVGSIAGVTLMSMEGVGFLWYLGKVSPWAALGFGLSLAAYDVQRRLTGL